MAVAIGTVGRRLGLGKAGTSKVWALGAQKIISVASSLARRHRASSQKKPHVVQKTWQNRCQGAAALAGCSTQLGHSSPWPLQLPLGA